jgi:hypothetical protein
MSHSGLQIERRHIYDRVFKLSTAYQTYSLCCNLKTADGDEELVCQKNLWRKTTYIYRGSGALTGMLAEHGHSSDILVGLTVSLIKLRHCIRQIMLKTKAWLVWK